MANASTYLKNQLIAHIFRTDTFAKPATLYVALYVGAAEVVGAGYARVLHGPGDSMWSAPIGSNGNTYNLTDVLFGAPTANWGVVTAFKVFDAATLGNILIEGNISAPKSVNNGDPAPKFPANTLIGTVS